MRIRQADAVVALQEDDQLQDVDRVEAEPFVTEEGCVVVDVLRSHAVQIEGVDQFQFDLID